jgi:hypothetical protein
MGVNGQRQRLDHPNGGAGILNQRGFRFGEAAYSPDTPERGPWKARRSHFRLILDDDYHRRIFEEADDPPRTWGSLLWVPEHLAHAAVARKAGRHFWIMPKAGPLAESCLSSSRITLLKNDECVHTAMELYHEYLWAGEAIPMNLESNGRLLIGLANRIARRALARQANNRNGKP